MNATRNKVSLAGALALLLICQTASARQWVEEAGAMIWMQMEHPTLGWLESGNIVKGRESYHGIESFRHETFFSFSPQGSPSGYSHRPVEVIRRTNMATPRLVQLLSTGVRLDRVRLDFVRISPFGTEEDYYRITLQDAQVVRLETFVPDPETPGFDVTFPLERLAFVYGSITYLHIESGLTMSEAWASSQLSMELTFFTAKIDASDVLLHWETPDEVRSAGFEIERREGDDFTREAFIPVQKHASGPQEYRVRLKGLSPGAHTFRLARIGFDGSTSYSEEIEVFLGVAPEDIYLLSPVYPHPFSRDAQFELAVAESQHVRIELFDVLGRRVAVLHDGVLEAHTRTPVTISLSDPVASGLYTYRIAGERFATSRQLLVVH